MSTALPVTDAERAEGRRRAVRAGVVANLVDQFDIFLPVVALASVPALTGGGGVVAPGLVFVATMLGRPLGAVVLGPLADRLGRARLARLCLVGVCLATGLVALLPLGPHAVALLLLLRLASGIFLGGQYSAAIPLALEWSRPLDRGRISGLAMAMSPTANATIALLTLVLQRALGADYAVWGWRVLFVVGAVLPLLAVVAARGLPDAPAGRGESPWTALLRGRAGLLQVLVLVSGLWLFTNMAVAVLAPRLKASGLAPEQVTLVMLVATAVSAPAMYLAGAASTRIGRRRFFLGFAALAVVAAPLLSLAVTRGGGVARLALVAAALQLVTVAGYGPIGAYLAERFPTASRSTGYGVAYSVSLVLPGLYPWYLPALAGVVGMEPAVAGLLALGAVLVGLGASLGPEPDVAAPLP